MDLTNNNTNVKTNQEQVEQVVAHEIEVETPTTNNTHQIHKPKPFGTTNGVLKRKNPYTLHHHHHPVVVLYKECLKNHAANIGGHAVDGCGEFMPSPNTANPTDPTSLKCAACGCHRNFHKRDEPEEQKPIPFPAIEYQPHHRHHPPPPPQPGVCGDHSGSPNDESPSPPPISSAYYPSSAPHMLLALSTGFSGEKTISHPITRTPLTDNSSNSRKRFRTRFTPDQKAKMMEFAEQVGWKMQKRDDELINKFCHEIGVEKGVLKVWMHNNKNTVGKKSDQPNNNDDDNNKNNNGNGNTNGNSNENYVNGFCIVSRNNNDSEFHKYENKKDDTHSQVINHVVVTTNGSSTSC